METIDFLQPGMHQIRKSITDIDDSYNNEWDIIAELIQNSVDAIRKMDDDSYQGKINLTIDSANREIIIEDNGIGINPEELPILLKPFSSNKDKDNKTVGEKGVGLTFVMFNTNYFEVVTGNGDKSCKAIVKDSYSWKISTSNESLHVHVEDLEEEIQGTKIILKQITDLPIFQLEFDQLVYVLRTKTSLGNTKVLWDDDINIQINLKFMDQNNKSYSSEIPFKYALLTDDLKPNEKIDLNKFITDNKDVLRTDAQKREALFGKVIYDKGEFTHGDNRKIKYFAYFVPGRAVWDEMSVANRLISIDNIENQDYKDNFHYVMSQPGIYTSVKGMPTGIVINNPKTGYSGYWSNLFIIFEDPKLKFDIGRKSIHGKQSFLLQKYAKEIFNKYLQYVTKYASRDSLSSGSEWDKDEIFGEIIEMINLNSDNTLFLKSPRGQEAQVCAMFYEQAAKGNIKDLSFLTSGYKGRYDLYAKWGKRNVVIEFKAELKNILKDFDDEKKLFDEVNCIVCWDVSEDDESAFHAKNISISKIEESRFENGEKKFPNATHKLDLGGMVNPVYVIDLKELI